MASIFHAYDIRGIYPTDLNEDTALKIGKAAALYLKAKKLVVGQDARTSSDPLTQKLIEGIISTGCHVVMVSQTTTPLFYFSVNTLGFDGCIMVAASHNPAQYNGFKIVGRDTVPVGLSSGLHDVEGLMDVPVPEGVTPGSVVHEKLVDDYVNTVIELSGAAEQDLSQLRIVVDTSNGMSSLVLKNLFTKININVTPIFFDIDETFPNHSPDISRAENLKHLQAKVRELQANLGVAFDGDGDRIMLVDETGAIIRSETAKAARAVLIHGANRDRFRRHQSDDRARRLAGDNRCGHWRAEGRLVIGPNGAVRGMVSKRPVGFRKSAGGCSHCYVRAWAPIRSPAA